jgi:hypothetical protein
VSATTVRAARQPGRWPSVPFAAVPQVKHQSWPGSIGAPHVRQAVVPSGSGWASGAGASGGAAGAA